MTPRFCTQCGTALPSAAVYCQNCRFPVENMVPAEADAVGVAAGGQPQPGEPAHGSSTWAAADSGAGGKPALMDPFALVSASYRLWKQHFVLLYAATVLPNLAGLAIKSLLGVPATPEQSYSGGAAAFTAGIDMVFALYASGAVVWLTAELLEGKAPRLSESFQTATRVYPVLLVVGILNILAVMAGMLLFVVPGVIAFVLFSVAQETAVLERRGIIAAFQRSYHLVSRDFWSVFLRLLVIGALMLVPCIVFTVVVLVAVVEGLGFSGVIASLFEHVLGAVVGPLYVIPFVLLFLNLRDAKGPADSPGEN